MGICDSLCINSIAIRAISCCLVIAVRADLREEFDMADEAFALSPISARATLPSEEDYAAIAEAFMETSRGRWFLTEYAKRNRNTDTRMVLDAVARIEQSLAAQREEDLAREASLQRDEGLSAQQAAEAVAAAAAAQERLTEALAAIRRSVEAAEESAVEALDSLALEQRLAPVRKGARVLREIAWRLREIGNDGRICDLIDSQVTVIERGTDQFSSEEARAAMRAAFAALQGRLVEFSDDDRSLAPADETEAAAPSPTTPEMAAAAEMVETFLAQKAAEAPSASPAKSAEAVVTQPETAPAKEAAAEEAAVQEIVIQEAQDADAQDEAVLDMIAMEMGAPDPISDDEILEAAAEQARLAEPAPIVPEVVAKAPEPIAAPGPVQQMVQPPPPPAAPAPPPVQQVIQPPPPAAAPAVEMSLGSSLIASGMLRKPVTAANDPLAPIRRMSQAEKIAFFS
jgi:hypothetical protein